MDLINKRILLGGVIMGGLHYLFHSLFTSAFGTETAVLIISALLAFAYMAVRSDF